jgi:glucosamine kinase
VTSRHARTRPRADGWAAGVDVGGTWIRAVALGQAGRRRRAKIRRGPGEVSLPVAVRRALAALRLEPGAAAAVVVAARGVWTAREERRARRALAGLAPHIRVISDVEGAYAGALGTTPGILLLAGTGSIAVGRDAAGRWHRAGGLGPLLGDEGSAFWIGRAWLRAMTGRRAVARLRRIATAPDAVARIAAAAPAVLREARGGHRAARAIVRLAQRQLARTVIEVAQYMKLGGPVPVSLAGSLLGDLQFRAGVWRRVGRAGLAIAPRAPSASAAEAAARKAAAHFLPGNRPGSRSHGLRLDHAFAGRREGSSGEAGPEGRARGVVSLRRAPGRGPQRSRWALIAARRRRRRRAARSRPPPRPRRC